jgi:GDP-L-fucose synthase
MGDFWKDRVFIVTGAGGFLGKHFVKSLLKKDPQMIITALHGRFDLTNIDNIKVLYDEAKAYGDKIIVIHLAASIGGIGINQEKPAEFFYNNILMSTQLMHEAYTHGFEKFVQIGTTCSYPKYSPIPFKEENLWLGYPEETNASYGIAKKAMIVQGEAYKQQYGFNSIHLILVNMYGPGDNFKDESSHVIPAMIKKFIHARNNNLPQVTVWGDGSPTREFLYVEDAVDGILLATEKYNSTDPVNLGTGKEISIFELSKIVKELTHYNGEIVWDTLKPNGQPRRCMDISKARERFGFEATSDFRDGLIKTIEEYERSL